jgi:hypothetical protein
MIVQNPRGNHADGLSASERRLIEAFDQLWNSSVDPTDALADEDGMAWLRLGGAAGGGIVSEAPFATEAELDAIRAECRGLATTNEYAINGHENLVRKAVSRCGTSKPRGRIAYSACRRAPTRAGRLPRGCGRRPESSLGHGS